MTPRPILAIGPFRLDPVDRLLSRDGRPVSLTPKAIDTLLVLVERRGRLVAKEELLRAVWPDAFAGAGGSRRSGESSSSAKRGITPASASALAGCRGPGSGTGGCEYPQPIDAASPAANRSASLGSD